MRPPICAICQQFANNDTNSGLLRFKLSEADIAFNKKFEEPGFVGHKKGTEWFCAAHYDLAKKYTYLHLSEALSRIKNELKEG